MATFQPFTDRLSRDIRNTLSSALVRVIQERSLEPAQKVANGFLANDVADCYVEYIENRLQRYNHILDRLGTGDDEPLGIALLLWDEGLFFEVHEVLEHAWMDAQGEEKLFYQAMIRAAGVYIKLEAGYPEPAARIAAKALPILKEQRDRLRSYGNPEHLLTALNDLNTPPPKLLS